MTTLKNLARLQTVRREMLTRLFVRSMTKAQLFASVAKNPAAVVVAFAPVAR